jgi:hypothetical protein
MADERDNDSAEPAPSEAAPDAEPAAPTGAPGAEGDRTKAAADAGAATPGAGAGAGATAVTATAPAAEAARPAGSEPDDDEAEAPHRHRILVGVLFTLATVLGVFAVLAVWVNRQALNTDNWVSTSTRLLADPKIQNAVASYSVTQLFGSGIPENEIKSILPKPFQAAAGPAAAGLEQLAQQAAPKLLASSQIQTAWREANRTAHEALLRIINGGGKYATTSNGTVTLNLHTIITDLAAQLGVQSQVNSAVSALQSNRGTVNAAANQVGVTLPANLGQLTILHSDQLKTAQDIASAIKGLALVLPIITFALFALAVYLARGRRREALRLTGWCFVGIGLLVLLTRRVGGNQIISALVKNPANDAAAHDAWDIATTLLYDIAVALIAYGLVFVASAWLAGRTRPARALRRAMAPTLRTRPESGYIAAYIVLLLVIIWGPTPATRQLTYIILFIVLVAIGITALRRQTEREFPEAEHGDTSGAVRDWYAGRRAPAAVAATAPTGGNGGRIDELERLATLHEQGSLTDDEFAAEKAAVMNGS